MTLISKTEQAVGEARPTVGVNDDDINAGYNDVALSINKAGGFRSFPAGASLGNLFWFASNNAGNYNITATNASFGQATNFKVHDPANVNAVFMIGATDTPFVSGNIPMASGVNGLFVDSGIAASNYQPLTAIVTLTAAQVLAAYATPELIIAAPSSSHAIMILSCQIVTQTSTVFAGGGATAALQYTATAHGLGANALSATIPSAEITAATSQIYSMLGLGSVPTTVSTGISGEGIYFSNITSAYTGGALSTLTFVVQYVICPATV